MFSFLKVWGKLLWSKIFTRIWGKYPSFDAILKLNCKILWYMSYYIAISYPSCPYLHIHTLTDKSYYWLTDWLTDWCESPDLVWGWWQKCNYILHSTVIMELISCLRPLPPSEYQWWKHLPPPSSLLPPSTLPLWLIYNCGECGLSLLQHLLLTPGRADFFHLVR